MTQKSSVPWCYEWRMFFHFSMDNVRKMGQKRSVPWCCKSHMWQYFTSHNAVNDTHCPILFWEYFTDTIKKKARYHDAVHDTHYFILVWKSPHKYSKKRSVPWCCKSRMWPYYLWNVCKRLHKRKVQYHNAVNDTRYLILFWEYPTETIKKTRYHDAVHNASYFIFVWKIPHK